MITFPQTLDRLFRPAEKYSDILAKVWTQIKSKMQALALRLS